MKFWGLLAVLAAVLVLSAVAVAAYGDPPDFSKMRIKELRKILAERGAECAGCSEKFHLVERVREVWDQPVISSSDSPRPEQSPAADQNPAPEGSAPAEDTKPPVSQESTEELLERLKNMPGMENLKMFTANDLKNGRFPGADSMPPPPKKSRAEHREELISFYTRFGITYEDAKIEAALDKFKGKEQKMFRSLYKKYDKEIKEFWAKEAEKTKEGSHEQKKEEDKPLAEEELR